MGNSQSSINEGPTETTPDMTVFQYFDSIAKEWSGSSWNDSNFYLLQIFKVKNALVLVSSASCVAMSFSLITFISTEKQFRSLKFCPIVAQALVDINGPGAANCVYEILKIQLVIDHSKKYDLLQLFRSVLYDERPKGVFPCVLTFLNEYSTGPCIVATAFVRYALHVFPIKISWVTKLCFSILYY